MGRIIAYFKYQTTKQINESQNTPGVKLWQRNFYDHIIRNDKSLNKIREYVTNNPILSYAFDFLSACDNMKKEGKI